ncbi:MAG: hypothetical protein K0S75_1114, partial [Clostridia bacterium]|nr:hypothetical protein [Clostridia bacterium]
CNGLERQVLQLAQGAAGNKIRSAYL